MSTRVLLVGQASIGLQALLLREGFDKDDLVEVTPMPINEELERLEARNTILEDVAKAAKLSQNYGPDSTDTEWDDFWRGIEKSLSKLEES